MYVVADGCDWKGKGVSWQFVLREALVFEIMSQHFHIWRDKQTIQGLWPNCIWRDKQNQEKGLVFESKTGKPKCMLHKNSSLDFIQTYTSRRVAYLCIFLYISHCHQNPTVACIAQTFTTTCHSTIIKHGAVQKKITHLMVSEKAMLPHIQKYSSASRCQIEQYRGLQDKSPPQIFCEKHLTLFAVVPDRSV